MKLRFMMPSPILLSLVLYGLSLAVPAFEFVQPYNRGLENWYGWKVLLMGWLGVFFYQFGWLANPLYIVNLGLLAKRLWRPTTILGIVTLAVGLNTLFLFNQKVPYDGSGATAQLKSLQIGFYFWIVSLSIPFLWSCRQLWLGSSPSSKVLKDT